ncbi:MAG: hypothetical protein AAGD25_07960 [Cyanobacteria bacterium P01_F01_bin.150]
MAYPFFTSCLPQHSQQHSPHHSLQKHHDNDASRSASYQMGYQQALDDFGLVPLLNRIQTHSDRPTIAEAEAIAALLIQLVTTSLTDNCLSAQLNTIRHYSFNAINPLAKLHIASPKTELPNTFPNNEPARFEYGDRLHWSSHQPSHQPINDWGIVIGRFYSFAPHRCHWRWAYLIWLDSDSPSSAWINADIAWEDDLEPIESEYRQ